MGMALTDSDLQLLEKMKDIDGCNQVLLPLAAQEIRDLRQQLAARDELLKSLHQRAYMRLAYHECGEIERLLGLPSVVDHELEDLK